MDLFNGKDKVSIPFTCKLCLEEIRFEIKADEYNNTTKFPIKKEDVHGTPPHRLIVYLNKNLEIANFKVEDILEKDVSYSQELTKQVLSDIELSDDEIELYFLTTGRDAVSLGEMSILIGKPKEDCEVIAEKFVQKGLYKKIIGATPHYSALPPYAALISQLQDFNSYIRNIKENISPQLEGSFSQFEEKTEGLKTLRDYGDFMNTLKQDMLSKMNAQKVAFEKRLSEIDKIRPVTRVLEDIEEESKKIMETEIGDLSKNFEDIRSTISENLKKLRLGVIQETVDQVIEKVFAAGLERINEKMSSKFGLKLNTLLGNLITNINEITKSTASSGENINEIFADMSKSFSKTIVMAEEKLSGITDNISAPLIGLKNIFTNQVMKTLDNVLDDILRRLEINEKVTAEFWDRAKRVTLFSMRDIWFIRSIEGAKAHINEEISKAKMRILIVAPEITDIDIDALKALRSHVNIRIAANINPSSSAHMAILQELDQMTNVSYRHRRLQNLWAINRDYEEVVICVISKTEIRGELKTEIAGIGSIIEEHIKIFVPILEDAWVGAQKDVFYSPPKGVVKPEIEKPVKLQISLEKLKIPQKEIKKQFPPEPSKEEIKVQEEIEHPQPISEEPLVSKQKIIEEQKTVSIKDFEKMEITTNEDLSEYFNFIKESLNKKSAVEISILLGKLHDTILKIKGFSGVLDAINRSISDLNSVLGVLDEAGINEIQKKLIFWKMKLHI